MYGTLTKEAPNRRVLVLFEPGRAGLAAMDLAREPRRIRARGRHGADRGAPGALRTAVRELRPRLQRCRARRRAARARAGARAAWHPRCLRAADRRHRPSAARVGRRRGLRRDPAPFAPPTVTRGQAPRGARPQTPYPRGDPDRRTGYRSLTGGTSASALSLPDLAGGGGHGRASPDPLADPDRGSERRAQEHGTEIPRAEHEHHRDAEKASQIAGLQTRQSSFMTDTLAAREGAQRFEPPSRARQAPHGLRAHGARGGWPAR